MLIPRLNQKTKKMKTKNEVTAAILQAVKKIDCELNSQYTRRRGNTYSIFVQRIKREHDNPYLHEMWQKSTCEKLSKVFNEFGLINARIVSGCADWSATIKFDISE